VQQVELMLQQGLRMSSLTIKKDSGCTQKSRVNGIVVSRGNLPGVERDLGELVQQVDLGLVRRVRADFRGGRVQRMGSNTVLGYSSC
jgi:hypothetical protein